MNRPPIFNREGALVLFVYSTIALGLSLACGSLATLAWGLWPGIGAGALVGVVVVLLLCSLYTGNPHS